VKPRNPACWLLLRTVDASIKSRGSQRDGDEFLVEAAFARCNGTAPKPASSGQTIRYRLSRGGDRQANNALHTIARIRARHDESTRAYLERRQSEGKTPREAMRALKRHLSRSLYKKLITIPLT